MGTQIIDYDDFTYGELVSIVQQEGLRICQDLKLQKHLKWELKRTKVELGSFCAKSEEEIKAISLPFLPSMSNQISRTSGSDSGSQVPDIDEEIFGNSGV
ncbi:hypothetical protein YC2023_122166 [Brassica napus]